MDKKPRIKHINIAYYCHFITTNTKDRIDWLAQDDAAYEVVETLYEYRELYNFKLLAFVVMPDHLHLMIAPGEKKNISEIIKEIKRTSSIKINKQLERKGPLWQAGYFDNILEGSKMVMNKIKYIHRNPVRAGLCDNPEDYEFSSANEKWIKDWDYL